MFFPVYPALLVVSGQAVLVYGHVAATSIRGERYEPAAAKNTVPLSWQRLSLYNTGRNFRELEPPATSSAAGDASKLRISSREAHHHEDVAWVGLPLKPSETSAAKRSPETEQDSKPQDVSNLHTPSSSVIVVAEEDKLWKNIGLITGVIAALIFSVVLTGVLFVWLSRRRRDRGQGKACEDISTTKQPSHRHTQSMASTPDPEFFIPVAPCPAWQLPAQYVARSEEQLSGSNSMWMNNSVVSPIDSSDGLTPLSNFQPSPIESNYFYIQPPPASYHWQNPVELPAMGSPVPDDTPLPSYREASMADRRSVRFSWTQDAEACYRPSERIKN